MDHQASDEAVEFIHGLSKDQKEAVFDYAFCKERYFDSFYDLDPWDFRDEITNEFNDSAFKDAMKGREAYVEQCEADFKASGLYLKLLGIDPIIVEALQLNTYSLIDINRTIQESNTMNNNSTSRPDQQTKTETSEPLRKLPILMIHDTQFYVDMEKSLFRQVDQSQNVIAFKDVQDNRDHSAILYDPKTKNAFQGTKQQAGQRADVILVRLPALLDLDPEFAQRKLDESMKNLLSHIGQDAQHKQDRQTRKPSKGMGI